VPVQQSSKFLFSEASLSAVAWQTPSPSSSLSYGPLRIEVRMVVGPSALAPVTAIDHLVGPGEQVRRDVGPYGGSAGFIRGPNGGSIGWARRGWAGGGWGGAGWGGAGWGGGGWGGGGWGGGGWGGWGSGWNVGCGAGWGNSCGCSGWGGGCGGWSSPSYVYSGYVVPQYPYWQSSWGGWNAAYCWPRY
jgi:hypothetical protein